jgi:hypothetical protein
MSEPKYIIDVSGVVGRVGARSVDPPTTQDHLCARLKRACMLAWRACMAQEYGQRRLKDTEFVLPLCIGSVAWWQGKKVHHPQGRGPAAASTPMRPCAVHAGRVACSLAGV